MSDRYQVRAGSVSGHCCFEATVVDTASQDVETENVCECLRTEHALMIAAALNARETPQ